MFHPGFAISPACISRALAAMALVGMTLISGASAASAQGASGPQAPSACQNRLASASAIFTPIGDLAGQVPAGCGGPDVVLLRRVVLPDHTEVAVEPPATLRCEMAEAVTDFVRDDVAPAAAAMGAPPSAIENVDSYDCRSRNRVAGARLSEHGRANALDIRAVKLRDGRVVRLTDPEESKGGLRGDFQEILQVFRTVVKTAACRRFTTVLGPGSDGYHEDHIHLDRIERPSGYRICQWNLPDEPRFGLQAVATRPAAAALLHGPVPLPRPRPSMPAVPLAVTLSAESRP
jgi:hypothetical protein